MDSFSASFVTRAIAVSIILGALFALHVGAQSTELSFPTAITENQLSGTIKARDLGDPRLTTYYYTFNGNQGDLFLNVVTKNLSGSIDVFAADDMRPLTKILVYADLGDSETGRVVYLRKPEKLILRIEGRTPNDDPAEFQIKFAGGFLAAVPVKNEPAVPKVSDLGTNDSGIKVNSAGTIVAVVPKPKPSPLGESVAEKTKEINNQPADENRKTRASEVEPAEISEVEKPDGSDAATGRSNKPTSTRAQKATVRKADGKGTEIKSRPIKVAKEEPPPPPPTKRKPPKVIVSDNTTLAEPAKVDPLANVRLVITFKDGRKVERPMTEVLRFTADQTTLTVISINGRVVKFPILDVASVNIQ